ncbi:MAG: cytochrome c peroxidase [Woeseiaceae bacterium]|nr:cytochrome c peroxidase [Woeseiaceae bacterium]
MNVFTVRGKQRKTLRLVLLDLSRLDECFQCLCVLLLTLAAVDSDAVARAEAVPVAPATDESYYDNGAPRGEKVELGRLLFFDKLLSGNRNISCATCHHPSQATSDSDTLSLGEGASGLGRERVAGPDQPVLGRLPRNSPALFNLGAREFTTLFHDGRVERDDNGNWASGFWTPAREQLPPGLDNVLAAQAMFPVLSPIEMAGHKGENEIADAVSADRLGGEDGAWDLIAARLRGNDEYVRRFRNAFEDIDSADDITYVHAANAIAAFEATAFRSDQSPFDRFTRTGDVRQLSPSALRGMTLFYGDAGCADCHSGVFQTDHQFHAIAMPQIGPGKGDGSDQSYWQATGFPVRLEDRGRYRVTFDPDDLYRFRTPSLRNVAQTGPWGHAGTFATLEAVVRHHLDPVNSLHAYSAEQASLPVPDRVIEAGGAGSSLQFVPVNPARIEDYRRRDSWVQGQPQLRDAIAASNQLAPRALGDGDVQHLIAFLNALTDPSILALEQLVPDRVPSGLPVAD